MHTEGFGYYFIVLYATTWSGPNSITCCKLVIEFAKLTTQEVGEKILNSSLSKDILLAALSNNFHYVGEDVT